jgi:hypothetical protein
MRRHGSRCSCHRDDPVDSVRHSQANPNARRQSIGDAAREEVGGTRRERIRPARRQDLGELLSERRDAGAELGDTRAQIKRQA